MSIFHSIISYYNANPSGSTANDVSSCILEHINDVPVIPITALAEYCNASVATVNRQIKAMCGLSYKQFQNSVSACLKQYPYENHCYNIYSRYPRSTDGYLDCFTDSVRKLRESISEDQIDMICKEITRHSCIRVYLPFSDTAPKCQLQMDLLVSGKKTVFLSDHREWAADVNHADENSLLLVSNIGRQNDFLFSDQVELLMKANEKGATVVSINAIGRPDLEKYSDIIISYEDTGTAMNDLLTDLIINMIKVVYRTKYMNC